MNANERAGSGNAASDLQGSGGATGHLPGSGEAAGVTKEDVVRWPVFSSYQVRRSFDFGELVGALAKAQLAYKPIVKAVENTFYTTDRKKAMYADLAAVIAATQKALAENGLVIIQSPLIRSETKEAGVLSLMAHSSGQWIEVEALLPATAKVKEYKEGVQGFTWGVKFDAQTCGIAITYARRYTYQSQSGVAAEEDDDANSIGEAATGSKEAQKAVAKEKTKGVVPALFWTWADASQTATITGSQELLEANRALLKKFWSATAGAIVVTGEQLEGLKYEFEQKGIEFKQLKAK